MKRQQAEAVLNRFFEECGDAVPSQGEIEPVLDRVWERLEWKADEFVDARIPAAPVRPFRFAWAAGIVLVAVFVNALVWSQGPPFSDAVKTGRPTNTPWRNHRASRPPRLCSSRGLKMFSNLPASSCFRRPRTQSRPRTNYNRFI